MTFGSDCRFYAYQQVVGKWFTHQVSSGVDQCDILFCSLRMDYIPLHFKALE